MGMDPYSELAEHARRGQWRLPDLPWDEPVKFAGSTRRERLLCKFDLLDASEALYHFKLGARRRMGELYLRAWTEHDQLTECLEWLDTDELRQLKALRRLHKALFAAGQDGPDGKRRASPERMWSVSKCPRGMPMDVESLALRLLVDEAVTHNLFRSMARQSHVPLARAVFNVCARDDERHGQLMKAMLGEGLVKANPVRVVALQGVVIAYVARLQNAFRPYFRSYASVTGTTTENVASDIFRAISGAVGDLGPAWVRYPTARIVHSADRSPWMLWLLR